MSSPRYEIARTFYIRADRDSELISFLTKFAEENDICFGAFVAFGALRKATLAWFNQTERHYEEFPELPSPHEMASCTGNITLRDGHLRIHAHAVLTDQQGNTRSGHLSRGTVFSAYVHLSELRERRSNGEASTNPG
ncbi:MAG: DUF296 domain-containing protein [Chloroflexota bacterium]|nr:DUF296 domain-containing protein [Chloroflexota bacterium]